MTSKRISAVVLIVCIVGVLLGIISNSRQSEDEFPKYNRFYYVREYMSEIENFLKRNFPKGEEIKNASIKTQLFMGQKEFAEIFIGDDILIENISQYEQKTALKNQKEIQSFVESQTNTPVAVLYIPTKYAIEQHELPENAELFAFNQKNFIEQSYTLFNGKATTVNVYPTLLSNSEKYLFYKTDPNLTSLGAYYIYTVIMQRLGIEPLPQDSFLQEHICHDFYGETYQKSSYKEISPDIITLYTPTNQNAVCVTHYKGYSYSYNELYPKHLLNLDNKLDVILGGDSGDITIENSVNKKRSILVIGDSSTMPILPFISAHYSTVRFIDFEFWNDIVLKDLDVENFDQVLISYSVESMISEPYPSYIKQIRQMQEKKQQS